MSTEEPKPIYSSKTYNIEVYDFKKEGIVVYYESPARGRQLLGRSSSLEMAINISSEYIRQLKEGLDDIKHSINLDRIGNNHEQKGKK